MNVFKSVIKENIEKKRNSKKIYLIFSNIQLHTK